MKKIDIRQAFIYISACSWLSEATGPVSQFICESNKNIQKGCTKSAESKLQCIQFYVCMFEIVVSLLSESTCSVKKTVI